MQVVRSLKKTFFVYIIPFNLYQSSYNFDNFEEGCAVFSTKEGGEREIKY